MRLACISIGLGRYGRRLQFRCKWEVDHVGFGVTGREKSVFGILAGAAVVSHDRSGEFGKGVQFGIEAGGTAADFKDLGIVEAVHLTDGRVGGLAIAATVDLARDQVDDFAFPGTQRAFAVLQGEVIAEGRVVFRVVSVEVRDETDGLLQVVEDGLVRRENSLDADSTCLRKFWGLTCMYFLKSR